jgi:hypothetical protein
LNVDGAVCLNNICMSAACLYRRSQRLITERRWANVTAGASCVVENTAYTAYQPNGDEFIDIVSRYGALTFPDALY